MDLLFGVSLFLGGCICFPQQKGSNMAHGYYVDENPQTSNQFHSGAFLSTDLKDNRQFMGNQSFVSPQREPVHFDVSSLGENMVQNQPDSGQEQEEYSAAPYAPAAQKYESTQHPFAVLLKQHAPAKTVEGISFPAIRDFRRFIETMKSSYLQPGSDSSRHFQTARETMKNELTSGAQRINEESSMSNSVEDGSARDGHSHWSEPDANDHKPINEKLPLFNPVDSTESVIYPSGYGNQDSGSNYLQHNLGATEHVSSDYGSLGNYEISGGNHISSSAADEWQNEGQPTSHNLPEQTPPGHSFSRHVTASPVPNSPSQDLRYYSSRKSTVKPLFSEETMQQPTYASPSGEPSDGYQQSRDFQREEHPRKTQADVLSLQKPLKYGKSIFLSAPRSQFYIPHVSKHRDRPAVSPRMYKPTVGKESNDINSAATINRPVSSGSNFDLSPQGSDNHVGVEASGPHDPQAQVFSKKKPLRSDLFSVKPPSSQESSRRDGYLPNSVSHPAISAQTKPEKQDLSGQNLVSSTQEPNLMNDYAPSPPSRGLDSTQRGISPQMNDVFAGYPTSSPPNSELKMFSRVFGSEAMSKNFDVRDISSDRFPPADTHKKPGDPQSVSLNSGSGGDPLHTFTQQTNVQKRPADVNTEATTTTSHPSNTLFTSRVSASTPRGVFWRKGGNTKRLPPQRGSKASQKYKNTYVKMSRNSYVRSKVFLSKTRYSPYVENKTIRDQRKSNPRREKAQLFDGGGEQWRKNHHFQ